MSGAVGESLLIFLEITRDIFARRKAVEIWMI